MRTKTAGRQIEIVVLAFFAGLLLALHPLLGCRASHAKASAKFAMMDLSSTSLHDDQIPAKFTCDGVGGSPQLTWSEPPPGTASFALIATDPDAPFRTFVHWVIFDLPAATRTLPEALPTEGLLADGSHQGRNDFDTLGYGGPCPPGHSPHHYVFTLYALDTNLNLPVGAMRKQVEAAMQGHILATGELIAQYHR